MRDARRIEERDQGAGSLRFQVMATTAGALGLLVLVFGLGYMVGHRAAGVQQAESGEAHLDPLAKLDAERQAHDKMNFYSQLTQDSPVGKNALPPPPPALVPVVPAPVAATPPSVSEEEAVNAARAPRPAPEKPRVVPKPEKMRAADAPHVMKALSAGPAKSGEFTVQVSSFQTHAEARAFSASLERQGFKPFVVQATIPHKGTWYRVRLGRFDDEGAARQAKTVLGKADIPGWVLRSE